MIGLYVIVPQRDRFTPCGPADPMRSAAVVTLFAFVALAPEIAHGQGDPPSAGEETDRASTRSSSPGHELRCRRSHTAQVRDAVGVAEDREDDALTSGAGNATAGVK